MAERLSGGWPEHVDELLERLRQDGFRVGVPETVRLHQLLLALSARGVPLDQPARLAALLGPVLCRSASEQEAFHRHVEEWWPGAVEEEVAAPVASTAAALEEALSGVERRRARLLRWLPVTPLALAVAAGVVAAGVGGVVQVQRWRGAAPERTTIQQQPQNPIPQQVPVPQAIPQPPPTPSPKPAPPPPPIELARDDGLFLLPSELALLSVFGALFSVVVVQGAVRGWWWRQARLVLQRLPIQGEPQLHRIALSAIEPDLLALPETHRLGRALNIWQRLPSSDLDDAATVEASLRLGGWLTPCYGQRRQRRSYLFLIDQECLADQQSRHLRAWLGRLRQEGVLADWVCFHREPFFCQGPTGQGPLRTLAELAALHPEAVAVVVADGERFFSPIDGTPQPWLQELAAWPRRVAL
ncbi:MAG: hypothetical protein VKO39_11025, partial [Cyanobacteriota bacterium]|nr:hypothetical protein [Cyanobacteriota bacterium]